jgi:DNA-binding IclR family transcriptional regulator
MILVATLRPIGAVRQDKSGRRVTLGDDAFGFAQSRLGVRAS